MEHDNLWLFLVAFFLVTPPILVYLNQSFRAEGSCRLLTSDFSVPESVKSQMDFYRGELQGLGFTSRGILILTAAPNVAAVAEMYVNAKSCDMASVSFVFGFMKNGIVNQSLNYLEFVRRFRGSEYLFLQTNNLGRVGAFPDEPDRLQFRLPSIDDVRKLYNLHLQLLELRVPRARPYIRLDEEFSGDIVHFMETVNREIFERQTKRGWLKYDDDRGIWRPTLWGAFRMTYQELPPLKQLRTMRLRVRANRVLRELQMDH